MKNRPAIKDTSCFSQKSAKSYFLFLTCDEPSKKDFFPSKLLRSTTLRTAFIIIFFDVRVPVSPHSNISHTSFKAAKDFYFFYRTKKKWNFY